MNIVRKVELWEPFLKKRIKLMQEISKKVFGKEPYSVSVDKTTLRGHLLLRSLYKVEIKISFGQNTPSIKIIFPTIGNNTKLDSQEKISYKSKTEFYWNELINEGRI